MPRLTRLLPSTAVAALLATLLTNTLLAPRVEAAPIKLTATQQKNIGIRTQAIVAGGESPVVVLAAVVTAPANARVAVAAPFAGTVASIEALEGQSVRAGQPLATLFSRDMLASEAALTQARAERIAAAANARRVGQLVQEGIAAAARLEEAQARLAAARAMEAEQQRLMTVARPVAGQPGTYRLAAPIAGRVARVDVSVGSGVEAMASAFVVERTERLWLEARLPAADAGRVRPGMVVSVGNVRGKVLAVGSAVDPRSRAVVLRAEIPGTAGLLTGRAVAMTVLAPARPDVLSVPLSAVVRLAARDMVFVARGGGFEPVPVQVSGRGERTAAVSGALKPGEAIAVAGLSELKALATQD
ncbi:efflux RND transporter periplasmic adaptor subunit [Parapedomonas caeni]